MWWGCRLCLPSCPLFSGHACVKAELAPEALGLRAVALGGDALWFQRGRLGESTVGPRLRLLSQMRSEWTWEKTGPRGTTGQLRRRARGPAGNLPALTVHANQLRVERHVQRRSESPHLEPRGPQLQSCGALALPGLQRGGPVPTPQPCLLAAVCRVERPTAALPA